MLNLTNSLKIGGLGLLKDVIKNGDPVFPFHHLGGMTFIPCLTLGIVFIFNGGRGVGGREGGAKSKRGPDSLVYPLIEIFP